MKNFIIKTGIFTAVFFILLLLAEAYISMELSRGKRYYFQADWHDLRDHNAEVLFIGNSRTWVHADPFAVSAKFKIKCEVLAQDGQSSDVLWLKFRQYMRSNKLPREIYLQLDPYFISPRNDLYGIENYSTCFFADRADLTQLSHHKGYVEAYRYLPLAATDVHLLGRIIGGRTVPEEESYERTHGFMARNDAWKGSWNNPDSTGGNVSGSLNYLDSFVVFCRQNGVSLYGFYPPQSPVSYARTNNKDSLALVVSSLKERHHFNFTFLNYNNDSLYNDSTLFYNHMHLNAKGVKVFMDQMLNDPMAFRSFVKE